MKAFAAFLLMMLGVWVIYKYVSIADWLWTKLKNKND